MTDQDLNQLCEKWKEILRLQDWDTKIAFTRNYSMWTENSAGEVSFTTKKKVATIHILDPVDYSPNICVEQDIEKTVVHELLHLHLAEWSDMTEEGTPVSGEQAINALSGALVNLNRKE